ncbi:AAA family ATPase [Commensalibacter communis]|uniref:AAA family ATPase n=1 Tax=Commensalibacter communis TaxID=2972786 RepID=UPI002330F30C|nr:AAA family ATPase [Commensalibacter communis]
MMKVKNVHIQNFKRFTDLKIEGIPETAKMVVLVGQNGCGKTSVFEALNHRYNYTEDYEKQQVNLTNAEFKKLNLYQRVNVFQKILYRCYIEAECYNDEQLGFDGVHFRTAYRNDSEVVTDIIGDFFNENLTKNTLIYDDKKVSTNYQRLMLNVLNEVLYGAKGSQTIQEVRDKFFHQINKSVNSIFKDITIHFNYPLAGKHTIFAQREGKYQYYKEFSSGERIVIDLLLDIIVNSDVYKWSPLFIDEPEIHIHTSLQGKLIEEMYNLFSDNSQLWITTHSLGVMTKAKELSLKHPGSVVFLDFDGHNFDQPVTITPSPINRIVWQKFMSVALDGLEEKLAPEIIILCEGNLESKKRFNFDADIYTNVFQENYPNITFISGGSSNDLLQETKEFKMLSSVLDQKSKVIRLVDRDDHSDKDVIELMQQEIFTTSRRHIESYLFDDELIIKLVVQENKQDLKDQVIAIKKTALQNSINRGNASDDIKSAAGEIFTELKKLLCLTRCGNKTEAFMRNTMLPLITPETEVYKEMEREIIQPILKASKEKQ